MHKAWGYQLLEICATGRFHYPNSFRTHVSGGVFCPCDGSQLLILEFCRIYWYTSILRTVNHPLSRDKTRKRASRQARIRPKCCCKLYMHVHKIKWMFRNRKCSSVHRQSLLVTGLIYWRRVIRVWATRSAIGFLTCVPWADSRFLLASRFGISASEQILGFC
jgi:hypothetical protein